MSPTHASATLAFRFGLRADTLGNDQVVGLNAWRPSATARLLF